MLLVLFVVGTASRSYISRHKRLKAYTETDFELLLSLLSAGKETVVTPNTLTETSNLIRQIGEPAKSHISEVFSRLVSAIDETYVPSKRAIERSEFRAIGLTDSALLEILSVAHFLLTADLDLYLAALAQGVPAGNFNHIREPYLS
jgi:hypothetical protein